MQGDLDLSPMMQKFTKIQVQEQFWHMTGYIETT
jgi:hypothetical protein